MIKSHINVGPFGNRFAQIKTAPKAFTFQSSPQKVIFGEGTSDQLQEALETLNADKALLITCHYLNDNCRTKIAGFSKHMTEVYIPDNTIAYSEQIKHIENLIHINQIDTIVSKGGGAIVELAKDICSRAELPHIAMPTTYAGCEMTPSIELPEQTEFETKRHKHHLPSIVIYDVDLIMSLSKKRALMSGMQALAHAIEALYTCDRSPIVSLGALEAIRTLYCALPEIYTDEFNKNARKNVQYAGWLAGLAKGSVSIALHHTICHVLTYDFGLIRAAVHCAVLPHSLAFNADAADDVLSPAALALGGQTIGASIYDFARSINVPVSLEPLGLKESQIPQVAELVMAHDFKNVKPCTLEDVETIIRNAFNGKCPLV